MRMMLALAIIGLGMLQAQAPEHRPMTWTTLGTNGGPVVNAQRSEPANLLTIDGKPWLVDCGDGAMERLAAAGLHAGDLQTVFISHLHMDHIGGLQGLIGLRWMVGSKTQLTIYGPPGTDEVVAGILQSLKPSVAIDQIPPGGLNPEDMVKVVILRSGADIALGQVRVRAAENTHFVDDNGKPRSNGTESLSYRFDIPGYSIGYTGDTGPSESVVSLEKNVDLLVSEVAEDPGVLIKGINDAAVPAQERQHFLFHFEHQHLSARNAGTLASAARAKRLVFTHLSVPFPTPELTKALLNGAHETYKGNVSVASDMQRF